MFEDNEIHAFKVTSGEEWIAMVLGVCENEITLSFPIRAEPFIQQDELVPAFCTPLRDHVTLHWGEIVALAKIDTNAGAKYARLPGC